MLANLDYIKKRLIASFFMLNYRAIIIKISIIVKEIIHY